jgi:hypothetical protein
MGPRILARERPCTKVLVMCLDDFPAPTPVIPIEILPFVCLSDTIFESMTVQCATGGPSRRGAPSFSSRPACETKVRKHRGGDETATPQGLARGFDIDLNPTIAIAVGDSSPAILISGR